MKITIYVWTVLAIGLILLSCDKEEDHYNFNRELEMDDGVSSQRMVTDLPCGTGSLEFDYTVKATDELAILELQNAGACDVEVQLTAILPGTHPTVPRLPADIRQFEIKKDSASRVNSFTIPKSLRGQGKLHFKFICKQA